MNADHRADHAHAIIEPIHLLDDITKLPARRIHGEIRPPIRDMPLPFPTKILPYHAIAYTTSIPPDSREKSTIHGNIMPYSPMNPAYTIAIRYSIITDIPFVS